MQRKRDLALQSFLTLLALGVGILFGARFCAEPPAGLEASDQELRVVERIVHTPPQIIYECPPEVLEPIAPAPKTTTTKIKPREPERLPAADRPIDPLERQRLLAWVRDRSVDLEPCRDDSKEVYRLTVTLQVDAAKVTRVDINTAAGEASQNLIACLRARILRWTPPPELVENRNRIVFGLTF
ncbi:MAG: hypothetical protein H0U74_17185 [Bradymonadaceae bacterium]|nr:hypothetical protein [Lujinxingiaceae bacterium]